MDYCIWAFKEDMKDFFLVVSIAAPLVDRCSCALPEMSSAMRITTAIRILLKNVGHYNRCFLTDRRSRFRWGLACKSYDVLRGTSNQDRQAAGLRFSILESTMY